MTIKRGSHVRVNPQSKVYRVLKINEAEQTAYLVPAPNHPDGVKRDRVWAALAPLIEVHA